ncbi:helix-turn-helix transcriptional regulator [Kitasatospora sp. NPDC050543]|uniref:helix-turn-helix transcriptional regulator n=1 Tax=Kitasatospora sp. NPDC050543 TaxID=3364054 RepID=UPI00379C968E
MGDSTPLGEFLRARREALKPQDVGLRAHGRRRAPGLRREEVAVLAGVSSDYYMRLEQGRESSPSAQVVEALAAALDLDGAAAGHLRRLARTPPGPHRPVSGPEQVSPQLRRLLADWPGTPAFVLGPALDVLAHNALAAALHSGFERFDNLARMVFLDLAGRGFYQDWHRAAHGCAAELRAAYGRDPASARIGEVVDTLCARSPAFAALWARHDVGGKTLQHKDLHHSRVGGLEVQFHAFTVNEAPQQQLIVYQAEPGSGTAAAFAELAPPAGHRAPVAEGLPGREPVAAET